MSRSWCSARDASAAVELSGLSLGYARVCVVRDVNATVQIGDLVAVIGPNGAGKTTLLKAIAGLLRPIAGRVEVRAASRRDIGYLPQRSDIVRDFPISVLDMVSAGLWRSTGAFSGFNRVARQRVDDALGAVGLDGFGPRIIGTLSGGEFQRMLFARLMLQDAALILMDEPFNHIDEGTTADLLRLINDWHRNGCTIIVVLHDIGMVRRHFPRVICFERGSAIFGSTHELLVKRRLVGIL